ncbi:hypothetical protein AAA799B03_01413 [Marine Group I thaumarchaeote SCGC AAA799-B03]|uniref:Uncharacterized protein n=4 Tax=Marine Group I TaxID=905826 RepID=A0A087S5R1_9ARCH|nr:hypothetical protein AAA799N04_00196 [Marine Group I thaumarchaeote SCGC AAA799-N04]KFM15963.1 hypothetical protein AAA799D11_00752 [Marine Group I thaumarchaeote SCGC AAA799-D11]KFM17700.1 hypothetical protein SCCGRSA3_01630 [Marine Group I thaumarchaeote SCGC RSA3]KFM21065.1 hypothetical protein AAA799B03_01413 [Marine Group I thaumarchaeote SCGC AAA799-B03]
MGNVVLPLLGIASIALLFGMGMVFPVIAESFPIKIVSDSMAPEGKIYVSVDFDHDGICDEQAILISISTVEKIGVTQQCSLSSI